MRILGALLSLIASVESHVSRRQLVKGEVETVSEQLEPWFLVPKTLAPGEMSPILWRDDGRIVDPEAFYIGLPHELEREIYYYLEYAGILELSRMLLYEDPVEPDENRLYEMNDGTEWGAMGPANWEKSDLTWIDAANEESYETTLDLLRNGGFDVVLESIAQKFKLDGLMIHGVGVIVVSRFTGENMHFDIGDTGGKFFNVVFPISIPRSDRSQLFVGHRFEDNWKAPTNFRHGTGIVLGGNTMHGTGRCDYRAAEEFRVSIAVYLADLNDENIETIAGDKTSLFPNENDVKWFRAQQGRFYSGGRTLENDMGRKPYNVSDSPRLDCTKLANEGKCQDDLMLVRRKCPKSCEVYLEDDEYYALFDSEKMEL